MLKEGRPSILTEIRMAITTIKMKWLPLTVGVFTIIFIILSMDSINRIFKEDINSEKITAPDIEVHILPPLHSSHKSLCGEKATARGPGQRVVSFSFFGPVNDVRGYFKGIDENAAIFTNFYPHWTMRVYHQLMDDNPIWPIIKQLEDQLSFFDFCNVSSLPTLGNFSEYMETVWRFLPMADPLVDVFLSRDLDSRPSLRELSAINEWLTSNLSFHIMRDHPQHRAHIMAGMWGARRDLRSEFVYDLTNQILKRSRHHGIYGSDQKILKDVLWPAIKGDVLQHDSYNCKRETFKENGNVRPWPVQRLSEDYNYVGARVNPSQKLLPRLTTPCPLECRPVQHSDWDIC